ncbi:hypothetical protein BJX99DRAFT_57420 [Aspergillus californicus]
MRTVKRKTNTFLALLASCLSQLGSLKLVLGVDGLTLLQPLFSSMPSNGIEQPFFKNLKSLVIRDLGWSRNYAMNNLAHALRLPKLEVFVMININGDTERCPLFSGITEGSLNISKLTFVNANLDAERLSMIVGGCKALEQFNYQAKDFDNDGTWDPCQFRTSELMSVLESQAESLHTLQYHHDITRMYTVARSGPWKIGSLAPLINLRHFETDHYVLSMDLAVEARPNLKRLTICNISFPIYRDLKVLLRTDFYPNLRFVTLNPWSCRVNRILSINSLNIIVNTQIEKLLARQMIKEYYSD